jgi:hypothetical protein
MQRTYLERVVEPYPVADLMSECSSKVLVRVRTAGKSNKLDHDPIVSRVITVAFGVRRISKKSGHSRKPSIVKGSIGH